MPVRDWDAETGRGIIGALKHVEGALRPIPHAIQDKFGFIDAAAVPVIAENGAWHSEDVLQIHSFDAENRGIRDGDVVSLASRVGETALHAKISDHMQPGAVCTTFHHVDTGANVVTTEHSDWATSCPEYKVTAVHVRLSNQRSEWQRSYEALREATRKVAVTTAE